MAETETKTPRLESYPPEGWTPAQWESAKRTSERFNVPFDPESWMIFHLDGYIGRQFTGCFGVMFIGIEKDGYAHS